MAEKRYAIVRVEGCNEERLKLCPNMPTCAFCLYGDTKEQLIAKVRQVLEREIQQKHIEVDFNNGFILSLTTKGLAKKIVEFLGVE